MTVKEMKDALPHCQDRDLIEPAYRASPLVTLLVVMSLTIWIAAQTLTLVNAIIGR